MTTLRPLTPAPTASRARVLDLGGQAVHVFRFGAPVALAYEYFLDIPAVFRLLPDALEVRAYGPNRYRLTVGATDGHGHSMAAIFDLQAELEPGHAIRVFPAPDGPPFEPGGLAFAGALAAEAVFLPDGERSTVEYAVDIEMSIPIPGVLNLMPMGLLQNLGERAMEFKMTQMISGFTRAISADFHAWLGSG
jgi:hypothetical protein